MDIQTGVPFSTLTTMRLGGPARFYTEAPTIQALVDLYRNAARLQQRVLMIGGGSNLIVHDEGFDGLVIKNTILGFDVIDDNDESTTIRIGAGELWDSVVARSVEMNLSGIEALANIPGTAGAAPVQNIGAYGQELADTLVSVDAYDTQTDTLVQLRWEDCGFSYRHSIFRGASQGRYAITAITLKLYKRNPTPPFYASLQAYLDKNDITEFTPLIIRQAIIDIRTDTLPDPTVLPNSGSFFKNVIIDNWQAKPIVETYPDVPIYEMDGDKSKIATGWLIESVDLKGELLHGIRVHPGNALVLINESASGYTDLAAAREAIITAVRDKFQITIEQEPLEL
ncbi:MAG: UDP-N-acetylmuramate dehydrogenase [Candidatus Saccharimonadales bacterium]